VLVARPSPPLLWDVLCWCVHEGEILGCVVCVFVREKSWDVLCGCVCEGTILQAYLDTPISWLLEMASTTIKYPLLWDVLCGCVREGEILGCVVRACS
jgi:hypothetical protein